MALRNLAWWGIVLGLIGCDAPDARFRLNMVYVGKQERESDSKFTRDQLEDLANVLTAMVGTPDEPFLPRGGSSGIDQLFELCR